MSGLQFEIKCVTCGATCWAAGWEEYDTNAAGIDDNDPLDDACEHIKGGGNYEIVDQEYESCEE